MGSLRSLGARPSQPKRLLRRSRQGGCASAFAVRSRLRPTKVGGFRPTNRVERYHVLSGRGAPRSRVFADAQKSRRRPRRRKRDQTLRVNGLRAAGGNIVYYPNLPELSQRAEGLQPDLLSKGPLVLDLGRTPGFRPLVTIHRYQLTRVLEQALYRDIKSWLHQARFWRRSQFLDPHIDDRLVLFPMTTS